MTDKEFDNLVTLAGDIQDDADFLTAHHLAAHLREAVDPTISEEDALDIACEVFNLGGQAYAAEKWATFRAECGHGE